MEKSKKIITSASILRNILTLRYEPSITSDLPLLTWKNFQNIKKPSIAFIENEIKRSLEENISNSTKKISIALSSGIDSNIILALVKERFPDIKINAITVKFSDSVDESVKVSKIAEHFQIDHHIVNVNNFLESLPETISYTKLPFWDTHWFYVAKKAQTFSKKIISGNGGDELFGGYGFRYSKFLSLINKKSTPLEKIKAYLECHNRDFIPKQTQVFDKKSNFSWDSIYKILYPYFDNSLSPLNQVFLADFNGKLRHNFTYVNKKINEKFNIKEIMPILSPNLIKYSSHLDSNFKYNYKNNSEKILLKKLSKKLKLTPFLKKEKHGFSVDTEKMWKNYGRDISSYFLLDSRAAKNKWISKEWIKKNIQRDDLDVRHVNKFLGLLAVEIWYRLFVTNEMSPKDKIN
ncbi:asparagine synthase C-terminal domain-containing protein [Nitrosopumilus sp.]|nr:asparagine synthase C-terminal domain-containing protein [Nitrosopumilus sp.]